MFRVRFTRFRFLTGDAPAPQDLRRRVASPQFNLNLIRNGTPADAPPHAEPPEAHSVSAPPDDAPTTDATAKDAPANPTKNAAVRYFPPAFAPFKRRSSATPCRSRRSAALPRPPSHAACSGNWLSPPGRHQRVRLGVHSLRARQTDL
jgi:hypothetical protein